MNQLRDTVALAGNGAPSCGATASTPSNAADESAAAKRNIIALHRFGPFLGTPDSSPFVIKVMMLLKLAGLPYRAVQSNPFAAPKRFLPFIDDDGTTVADSTFIRFHLEEKYGVDFDAGLSQEQRAVAWCVERMCEEHLYFALLEARWLDRSNFSNGLGRYMFAPVPLLIRPLAKVILRRMNSQRLKGHGMGRHSRADIAELARRDIDALAVLLGDRSYLMGDEPSGADATMFAFVTSILTPPLDTPLRMAILGHANLVGYRDRMTSRYFPELVAGTVGARRVQSWQEEDQLSWQADGDG